MRMAVPAMATALGPMCHMPNIIQLQSLHDVQLAHRKQRLI